MPWICQFYVEVFVQILPSGQKIIKELIYPPLQFCGDIEEVNIHSY
jgi:hypothetical protein